MDDGLLDQLRSAGQIESEGRFTLDLARALEKLRDHRLAVPHEYALALLSAAVRSGATRFDVRPEPSQVEYEFDGEPFPRAELEGLLSHLLGGGVRPAVLDLAAGVHAAMALEPVEVQVQSGGHLLTFAEGRERLEESPAPVTQVRVRWRFEALRWLGLVPELPILRRRGRLAPLRLEQAGRPMEQEPLDPGPAASVRAFRHKGLLRWSSWVPERQGPWDAVLAIGAHESSLTAVIAGVSYRLPLSGPGAVAVVACDDLRLDLTRSGPVQDEAWERLHEFLTQAFAEMLLALPREEQFGLLPFAQHLEEALPERDAFRRPLLELAVERDASPYLAMRLARHYVQLDLPHLARGLFPKALPGMHALVRRTWATQPHIAEGQVVAAEALAREAFGATSLELAEALAARAEVRALLGREPEAGEDAEAALLLAHPLRDRPSGALAALFDTLALGLRRDGRAEDALALHREAQLLRSRAAQPERSRSLLLESTAWLALGQPEAAYTALGPGFPEVPLLDVLAEACLRTDRLEEAGKVLAHALQIRGWPSVPKPAPEEHVFLTLIDELAARADQFVAPPLRRLSAWRSGANLLLPEGPLAAFEFVATAHEYARYGSLDLAIHTLRRASGLLEQMPEAEGRALHRALLYWRVALVRRLGRAAEADVVWSRVQLLTDWAPDA